MSAFSTTLAREVAAALTLSLSAPTATRRLSMLIPVESACWWPAELHAEERAREVRSPMRAIREVVFMRGLLLRCPEAVKFHGVGRIRTIRARVPILPADGPNARAGPVPIGP